MKAKAKAKAKVKPPQLTAYHTAVLRQMAVSKSPLIKTFDHKLGRVTWGLNNGRDVTDACARALIRNGWVVPVKDGMYDEAQTYVLPANALRPGR